MLDTHTVRYVPKQGCALINSKVTTRSSADIMVASMASERLYTPCSTTSDTRGIRPQFACDCWHGLQDLPTTAGRCIVLYHVDHGRTYSLSIKAVAVLEKGSWTGTVNSVLSLSCLDVLETRLARCIELNGDIGSGRGQSPDRLYK
jgi:hypothetical protein